MSIFLEIQRYKEIKKIKKETEMTLKNHINANTAPNIDINSSYFLSFCNISLQTNLIKA